MISSYGDQSTARNNPSYYYRASPTLPQLLWMLPETPYMFYTCNYNIRVTHRNGAIKHIFYTNRIHGGIISRLFFIRFLSLHALALHLAVKYYFRLSLMKIWARWPYIHLSVVFPPECQQDHFFVTQPILLSENIPNIWHKSSTKHKEVRPDWNDKADNANTLVSWKVS